jgi:hypothetical protein
MGISVQAEVADSDLAIVRDMGGHPGDEFQVIQPLHLSGLLPILIGDPALLFI